MLLFQSDRVVSVMKSFQEKEIENPSRRLEVVLRICNHMATVPDSQRPEMLIPCESPSGRLTLIPASKSVFIDSSALRRRLPGLLQASVLFISLL